MADISIVLFDGVCNLCNSSVQFIIKRDKKKQFLFAPLQGKKGQEIFSKHSLPAGELNSFILAEGDNIYIINRCFTHAKKIGWPLVFIICFYYRTTIYPGWHL